jgi:HSP20 family protein
VAKEDIHVDVHGKLVTLKAEIRQFDSQNKDERALRSERYYGSVSRSVELPVEVSPEQVSARFDNGILTLRLPKQAASPAPHRIPIE